MAFKTISIIGPAITKSAIISGTPTPGMIAEETTVAGTYKAHATAGGNAAPIVFLEDEEQGGEIGTAYTAGTRGKVGYFKQGEEFYGLLANGETAVVGSDLESNGDGQLRVVDADVSVGDVIPGSIIATAKDAVDMSGTTGADPTGRIRCEAR